MKGNTLAVALVSLLVGGVAVGAFHNDRDSAGSEPAAPAGQEEGAEDPRAAQPRLDYAEIVNVEPVTEQREVYATVTGSRERRETSTSSVPRQVCDDVVVQERLPERDGNVGGTAAGAVLGGIVGSNVGSGSGRRAATLAGAIAGGVIGNQVDKRHVGGRVVERVDRQCRTEYDTAESSRVTGWDVTFRRPDGSTGTQRTDSRPGERIVLGREAHTIGYDVTYRYDGSERTVRMDSRPEGRLPVIDGQVVLQTAAADAPPTRG